MRLRVRRYSLCLDQKEGKLSHLTQEDRRLEMCFLIFIKTIQTFVVSYKRAK